MLTYSESSVICGLDHKERCDALTRVRDT